MSVISLASPKSDGALSAWQQLAAENLRQVFEATSLCAPNIDKRETARLRKQLAAIAQQAGGAQDRNDYPPLIDGFRSTLERYQKGSQHEFDRVQSDLNAAIQMLGNLAEEVTSSGDDHTARLKDELHQLEAAAESPDISQIRAAIHETAAAVRESCESLQKANLLRVAQLQDEIRALHKEVEEERRAQQTDQLTGVWNREKLDSRIADLILVNQPFCIYLVGASDLRHILREESPECSASMLAQMMERISAKFDPEVMVGRWSRTVFAALFDVPAGAVSISPDELERYLNQPYPIETEECRRSLSLDIRVKMVERAKDATESGFYPRLGQAAFDVVGK